MIIFLFILFLSSVGVRSAEKADNSESEDNVSISLSLSRLCQGKADTSGQGSCLKKEEKEKITGLSDKITDIQAQQSKMVKTIAKLEKNVLEVLGADVKQLLKHIKTIQPNGTEENQPTEFSATIQQTTQPTEPSTESPASSSSRGCSCESELMELWERGTPGGTSVYNEGYTEYIQIKWAFSREDNYWIPESNQYPASIWMHFPEAHRLSSIGYRNKYDKGSDPKSLKVIGSNDCATWTTLHTVENTGFTKEWEFRKWVIPEENRVSFSCLGLMWPNKLDEYQSITVVQIRMWEEV